MKANPINTPASNAIALLVDAEAKLTQLFEGIQDQLAGLAPGNSDDILLSAGSTILKARSQIRDGLTAVRRMHFLRRRQGAA